MSISASLGSALSGLYAARAALDTISANVANANTVGYARKAVDLSARADSSGGGGGVEVRSIVRFTDAFLHDADVAATADRGRSEAYSAMASELDGALGEPGTGQDLPSLISKLRDALTAATAAPQDISKRRAVVEAADAMARGFSSISGAVTGVRDRSTATCKDLISKLNDQLASIAGLNQKIVSARQAGMETGLLEDQRDAVIGDVSRLIDLKLLRREGGAIDLLVAGKQVVSGSRAARLAASSDSSGLVALSIDGRAITDAVESGAIRGNLDVVNRLAARADADIRDLAASVVRALNAAHSSGTSIPGRQLVEARPWASSGETFSFTGKFRLMLVDSDGKATASQDIVLPQPATIEDFVNSVDLPGVTASFDQGKLTIDARAAAPARNLVWSAEPGSTVTVAGADGQTDTGASLFQFLGMNDMLTLSADHRAMAVRPDLLARPELLAHAKPQFLPSAPDFGAVVTGAADGRNLAALVSGLESQVVIGGADGRPERAGGLRDVSQSIVLSLAGEATRAAADRDVSAKTADEVRSKIATVSGVSIDEEMAQINLYQSTYGAAARVISVASQMLQDLIRIGQ